MHTIDLAYVGRGLHEELTAYIADQLDFYADEGVHVALRDGCDWDEERLRHGATIGLGRVLLSRMTSGIPWVARTVNTHRPLFWFLGRAGLTGLSDLAGRRLAVHAAHTAPGCFARIVLRRAGLDPDRDVECLVRPPGDYGIDLRQLREGTIDAAFVGSTMAPEAGAHYEKFIAPYFTTDGEVDLGVADAAIAAVASELGVSASFSPAEFYRTGIATPRPGTDRDRPGPPVA
jgi:NitT/TauT family transport system substrate-binding protein